MYSVSPWLNIKGAGVHQWVHDVWSTMFNQYYKTVFFSTNFKIKGWRIAMLPPFGGNTVYILHILHYHFLVMW